MMPQSRRFWLGPLIALVPLALWLGLSPFRVLTAQPPIRESFESADPTWVDLGGDTLYTLQSSRVQGSARSGDWCEQIQIRTQRGNLIHLMHPVRPARVIPDLEPSIWIRSDRPGVQLLARVVLPATIDPATRQPLETLLQGETYAQAGRWQRLAVPDPQRALQRRQTALQVHVGPQTPVDLAGAYVDALVINAYTGPGESTVWIDDLEIDGFVAATQANNSPVRRASDQVEVVRPVRPIEFDQGRFMVDGLPRLVRAIEYRGEPLQLLAELGFDAVFLSEPPQSTFLDEARRAELGVICPPPLPRGWEQRRMRLPPVEGTWDPVWLWNLGENLDADRLDHVAELAELTRQMDRRLSRPLIAGPTSGLARYRRRLDVLLDRHTTWMGPVAPADVTERLRRRRQMAGPTAPQWASIATHPPQALLEQMELAGGTQPLATSCLPDHLWMQLHSALAGGATGLVFRSQRPLDRDDPATRLRAESLRLVNLELSLIAPWLADGEVVSRPRADRDGFQAVLVKSGRVQLLLIHPDHPDRQFVPHQGDSQPVRFVLPGVPDNDDVFELLPTGLQPLQRRRVAGGTEVTVPRIADRTVVLMAQDVEALTRLRGRIRSSGPTATRLARNILFERLRATTDVASLLNRPSDIAPPDQWLTAARGRLQQAEAAMNRNEYARAYSLIREGHIPLRTLERASWREANRNLEWPLVTPFSASYWSLADHQRLVTQLRQATLGTNRLRGGDCEQFEDLVEAGWSQLTTGPDGVATDVTLTETLAQAGRSSLALAARSESAEAINRLGWFESPPVSLSTGEVQIRKGEVLRIDGWVYVPQEMLNTVEGLRVWDTLGGRELALALGPTSGWQRFRYFRRVPQDQRLQIHVELTGLGIAYLDSVSIRSVDWPGREEPIAPTETLPEPSFPPGPYPVTEEVLLPGDPLPAVPDTIAPLPIPESLEGASRPSPSISR